MHSLYSWLLSPEKLHINPFTPTDLFGMFQIKAWTIPYLIVRIERVKNIFTIRDVFEVCQPVRCYHQCNQVFDMLIKIDY